MYLDTSVLVKLYVREVDSEFYGRLVDGQPVPGALFDFGYAMTVHKAQGSGFKRVYLVKEKPLKADEDTYKRWLYSAVTRASEELTIVAK